MQQSCYVNDITSIDGSRTKFLSFLVFVRSYIEQPIIEKLVILHRFNIYHRDNPVDTGHKVNVHKTFRRRPITSCAYWQT